MDSLFVDDRVYGHHVFREPVIISLAGSPPLQRLKRIAQHGVPDRYYYKKGYSRFEHSVGVAVLLAKHGAPVKETVAGLLHDVSHTAFSHVIDVVFDNSEREDFQDKALPEILSGPAISGILKEFGYDPADFSRLEDFPLLERHVPNLCADRIDYCLRETAVDGDAELSRKLAGALRVHEKEFCFHDVPAAREFAWAFLKLQREHWAGEQAVGRYQLLGLALKRALDSGEVARELIFSDDETILAILERSKDPEIGRALDDLRENRMPDVTTVKKKARYADPKILRDGRLVRLSEIDAEFREQVADLTAANLEGKEPTPRDALK